jgi:hypothetical protein
MTHKRRLAITDDDGKHIMAEATPGWRMPISLERNFTGQSSSMGKSPGIVMFTSVLSATWRSPEAQCVTTRTKWVAKGTGSFS